MYFRIKNLYPVMIYNDSKEKSFDRQLKMSYNKKYNLANESTDIITDEDVKTLVKKIYTEEIPLIKKGVYK